MPIETVDRIWMDGELVDWDDATVHVLTHSLHYGCGVFEGIRAYETSRGPAVFRLREHIDRLFASAQIFLIDIPFSPEQLVDATVETVRVTRLKAGSAVLRGTGRGDALASREARVRRASRTACRDLARGDERVRVRPREGRRAPAAAPRRQRGLRERHGVRHSTTAVTEGNN